MICLKVNRGSLEYSCMFWFFLPIFTVKKYLFLFLSFAFSVGLYAQEMEVLWPGIPPGDIAGEVGDEKVETKGVKRISNVSEPNITYYLSDSAKANGTTVLVCPGGAYNILAIEHEGEDVCKWLNEIGVHAALLKYRVPRRKNRKPHSAPLQDAQRAMGLVREAGKSWDVPLTKLGIIGFSAGGNLAVRTATSFEQRTYESVDQVDELSCRPDFVLLLYPAYLISESNSMSLDHSIKITKECPPMFFAHAGDDHVPAEGSVLTFLFLEKAGVVGSELHVFPFGGHGFGLRSNKHPVTDWHARAEDWLVSLGVIKN
jgi:acetyl esterase/lipase